MNWLKKAGLVVFKIIGLETGLLPMFSQTPVGQTPTGVKIVDRLSQLFGVITTAEQMITAVNGPDAKTGSQKLLAAKPYVGALVQEAIEDFLKKDGKPKDEQKFLAAIDTITGGLADALNSYGD